MTSRWGLASVAACILFAGVADAQNADVNAEARVFFEQGNRHLEQAQRTRGRRQREAFEEALQAYVQSLRIVRSRNALWNAAGVLEALGRHDEAFAYYREYRDIPGLPESDTTAAEQRLDALRQRVAVVAITSAPEGAEVYVDRLDLAARGVTPFELALPAGDHRFFLRLEHYRDAELRGRATVGERTTLEATLRPNPVAVIIDAPGGALTIDGQSAQPGRMELSPGQHIARLDTGDGEPIERHFTLLPGQDEARVSLVPGAPEAGAARIQVISRVVANVELDGALAARDTRTVNLPVSAGSHQLRIETRDGSVMEETVTVEDGQTATVRVQQDEGGARRFGAFPYVLLGVTGAGVLITAVLGALAIDEKQTQMDVCMNSIGPDSDACVQGQADVEQANLVTDVSLGITAAVGITAIILTALNRRVGGGEPSTTIQIGASDNGFMAGARGTF